MMIAIIRLRSTVICLLFFMIVGCGSESQDPPADARTPQDPPAAAQTPQAKSDFDKLSYQVQSSCEQVFDHPYSALSLAGIKPGMYYECAFAAWGDEDLIAFASELAEGWQIDSDSVSSCAAAVQQRQEIMQRANSEFEFPTQCTGRVRGSKRVGITNQNFSMELEAQANLANGSVDKLYLNVSFGGHSSVEACQTISDKLKVHFEDHYPQIFERERSHPLQPLLIEYQFQKGGYGGTYSDFDCEQTRVDNGFSATFKLGLGSEGIWDR